MTDPIPVDVDAAKRELRSRMRRLRLDVASVDRSRRICESLVGLIDASTIGVVVAYDPVPGEPDLTEFVAWCADHDIETVAPAPSPAATDPIVPSRVDVFVVPGLAFTADGDRLGQGGGWYDRFLARRHPDSLVVGVAFVEQVVEALPTATHDVRVDVVITDRGRHRHIS